MSEATPTVFLVDDDAAVRQSLRRALGKRGVPIETFDSAQAFLDGYASDRPGCLLLDLSMPGMTGLELQEMLAEKRIDIPIVFITGHGNIQQSVRAMKAGAIDFLEKPFRIEVLLERIEEAFATDTSNRETQGAREALRQRFTRLTGRETEVMRLLVAGPANMSSKEIARQLGISPRTVDHHRARIMEKTEAQSVTELVTMAAQAGLHPPEGG